MKSRAGIRGMLRALVESGSLLRSAHTRSSLPSPVSIASRLLPTGTRGAFSAAFKGARRGGKLLALAL